MTDSQIAQTVMVYTVALVSPGPNFFLVLSTALGRTRREGLYTAAGVAAGSTFYVLLGLLGVILLIGSNATLYRIMLFAGGGFLLYMGGGMLFSAMRGGAVAGIRDVPERSALQSFRAGLGMNLTNPNSYAYYLSLFTASIPPETSAGAKMTLGVVMPVISLSWYSFVAFSASHPQVRGYLLSAQRYITFAAGAYIVWYAIGLMI